MKNENTERKLTPSETTLKLHYAGIAYTINGIMEDGQCIGIVISTEDETSHETNSVNVTTDITLNTINYRCETKADLLKTLGDVIERALAASDYPICNAGFKAFCTETSAAEWDTKRGHHEWIAYTGCKLALSMVQTPCHLDDLLMYVGDLEEFAKEVQA